MQFSTSTVAFAIFFTAIKAAPLTTRNPESADALFTSTTIKHNDYCGDSTFINESSPASPLVADCRQIATNIVAGGVWKAAFGHTTQIVSYGTCAMGVTGVLKDNRCSDWALHAPSCPDSFHVGNQDIIDLINGAINAFQWFEVVGAKGVMPCDWSTVTWGLYHT